MGLSSLVVIDSLIARTYDVQRRLNSLMQQKLQLQSLANNIGNEQSAAAMAPDKSMVKVQMVNFQTTLPKMSQAYYMNVTNPATGGLVAQPAPIGQGANEAPLPFPVLSDQGQPVTPGQFAFVNTQNPQQGTLGPGEMYMTKEAATNQFNNYTNMIFDREKFIDQQIEQLNAQLPALQKEQEQFEKYGQQNINNVFSNKFMA